MTKNKTMTNSNIYAMPLKKEKKTQFYKWVI
jgi:hypothetical protein